MQSACGVTRYHIAIDAIRARPRDTLVVTTEIELTRTGSLPRSE
jgi:hypothetical protein